MTVETTGLRLPLSCSTVDGSNHARHSCGAGESEGSRNEAVKRLHRRLSRSPALERLNRKQEAGRDVQPGNHESLEIVPGIEWEDGSSSHRRLICHSLPCTAAVAAAAPVISMFSFTENHLTNAFLHSKSLPLNGGSGAVASVGE